MTRVKRGVSANKKRKKILKATKGFRWGRSKKERAAKEALLHSQQRAFRGRKEKKRAFRGLWQIKINASARRHGITYSKLISALKQNKIALDRKILARFAEDYPKLFSQIVEKVKK